jgi:fructosamine-3-kinase
VTIWQHLETELQSLCGGHFKIEQTIPVAGGDVNQAYHLKGCTQAFFVKLNSAGLLEMFAKEAAGLSALSQTNTIEVPQAVVFGEYDHHSYLVMPYLAMDKRGDIRDFAQALAAMHLSGGDRFGFDEDNYIGKTPQSNRWDDHWGRFFARERIGRQLDILAGQGVSPGLIDKGHHLMEKLEPFLNDHNPAVALVHGDLWSGNYSFIEGGRPVIYDPAVYYGDAEVDLAMLELFGAPGKTFFAAYNSVNPIKPGYALRKQAYNLYHILNHANFFGGSYIQQSQWMIDELNQSL